jgi:hypothetical protein
MLPRRIRIGWLCAFSALLAFGAKAQEGSIRGKILDADRLPLAGAHIRLVSPEDTTQAYLTTSEGDGTFLFSKIPVKTYRLEVTSIGFQKFSVNIRVPASPIEIGPFVLAERTIRIGEVVVEGRIPPAVQNGDTTEYIAGAFKTNRDATAEELITKMPGITVDNGTVRAGGENVQRVLVDGKPYFGDDPTLALRNLPAEVIDKIQVFDQMSDQAQFTGFDDGQSVKAMNVMTRRERRDLEFGKFTAGYGNDGRYETGGNYNSFQNNRRISILGLSNNINEQNFTMQDLLGVVSANNQVRPPGQGPSRRGNTGGGSRRSPSGSQGGSGGPNPFLSAQQQGLNTSHMLGTNFSDSLADNLFTQASYFFNRTDNVNQQALNRQYVLGGDSTSLYTQNTNPSSRNFNHRINARVEYAADLANAITVLPQLYFQSNRADNVLNAMSLQTGATSVSRSTTDALNSGYDLSGHIVYRHRFDVPGRTVSVDVGVGASRKTTNGSLESSTQFLPGPASQNDTLDQQSRYLSNGHTLSANVVYTEPGGENGLIQVNYSPSFTRSTANKSTFDFDPVTEGFTSLDIPLSNSYANEYFAQNAGLGYRLRLTDLNMMAGISYQVSRLEGSQPTVRGGDVSRTFTTFLPNALLLYTMPDHRSLRIFYRASTRAPTVTQLQRVTNNTNPLLLTTGNPDLNQSYTHSLLARYSVTSTDRAQSMFLLLSATYTANYIANSTVIPARDTVMADGTRLSPGTQLTFPVNLDGYWNVRSFFTYGFPFDLLQSTLNLNSGITFARTPGLVNSARNIANATTLSQGIVLGSNISPDFDFTVAYTGSYNLARNTLQADANSNYYSHTASIKWTWTFWEGIVLRNDVTNVLTSGLAAGYDQNIVLWNASIAKKLFEAQRGEIKLGVADILGQNKNVSRTITDTYVEDTRNQALTRYIMLSFTYTIR